MKKEDLADMLRQKQLKLGIAPKDLINALSDDQIILCYITCSCCNERLVTDEKLPRIINKAKDVEDFFRLCDSVSTHTQEEHLH